MHLQQTKNNFSAAGEVESSLGTQPLQLYWQHSSTGIVALVQVASFRQIVYWREMDFAQPKSVDAVLGQLERELSSNSNLRFSFSGVQLCLDGAYVLVPAPVLEAEGPDKFLTKKEDEEYVIAKTAVDDACVLFAVNTRLLSFYASRFEKLRYTHSAANLIAASSYQPDVLHVNAGENDLDIVSYNTLGILQLCQRYPFVTDTDFLYFLMLVCDRFKLDREQVKLQLSGKVQPESSLLLLLQEYFRQITLPVHAHLRYSTALEQLPAHRHFVLLNPAL